MSSSASVSQLTPKSDLISLDQGPVLLPGTIAMNDDSVQHWQADLSDSAFGSVQSCMKWVRMFPLQKVLKGEKVTDAVHPFLAGGISRETVQFSVAPIKAGKPELSDIDAILSTAADRLTDASSATLKCLVVVLPNIKGEFLTKALSAKRDIKDDLLKRGILVGEFYPTNRSSSRFDPKVATSRPPAPMLVMRYLERGDWRFICRVPKWQISYNELFGAPPKEQFHMGTGAWRAGDLVRRKLAIRKVVKTKLHHFPSRERSSELVVFDSASCLARLEPDWERISKTTPFQTFDWNQQWYTHAIKKRQKPLIFTLKRGSRVEAILPCYEEGLSIRIAGDFCSDHQDVVAGNLEDATQLLNRTLGWISRNRKGRYLNFSRSSSNGLIHQIIESGNTLRQNADTISRYIAPASYVSIEGGYEKYLASLSKNKSKEFREVMERLNNDKRNFSFQLFRNHEINRELIGQVSDFHVTNFRSKGSHPLEDPSLRNFLEAIAPNPDVGIQIAKLSVDDEIIAVDIGFVRNSTYYKYMGCIDEEFSSYHPEKCLVACRIDEWFHNDGVQTFDLMSGDKAAKARYTNGDLYHVYRHRIFPSSITNRCIRVVVQMFDKIKETKRGLLGRFRS